MREWPVARIPAVPHFQKEAVLFRWLLLFLKRFVLFCVVVIGAARAFSWLLAYDDEVKLWASQNRSFIVLVLVLSAMMYAMYDWLEEDRG
jgi:hypothetical protein